MYFSPPIHSSIHGNLTFSPTFPQKCPLPPDQSFNLLYFCVLTLFSILETMFLVMVSFLKFITFLGFPVSIVINVLQWFFLSLWQFLRLFLSQLLPIQTWFLGNGLYSSGSGNHFGVQDYQFSIVNLDHNSCNSYRHSHSTLTLTYSGEFIIIFHKLANHQFHGRDQKA